MLMTKETKDPRELLAKMDAEEAAARETANRLVAANAKAREEILTKIRKEDLEDVRKKCELHGFTATDLRGTLKIKRRRVAGTSRARKTSGTPRKSAT